IRPDLVHDWIVLHGRRPGEGVRRIWLCPATWGRDGVTIGALTDRPQPAPPLPTDLTRFAGLEGPSPAGWVLDSTTRDGQDWTAGSWRLDSEGLHLIGAMITTAWREGIALSGDWVVEVYIRFPEESAGRMGGLVVESDGYQLSLNHHAEH